MDLCLNWKSCEWQVGHEKWVLRAAQSPHTPFSGGCSWVHTIGQKRLGTSGKQVVIMVTVSYSIFNLQLRKKRQMNSGLVAAAMRPTIDVLMWT